jgi:uncharacterized membrane protein
MDFGIFLKQFKEIWTSLVGSHEIVAGDPYLLLIILLKHSGQVPGQLAFSLKPILQFTAGLSPAQ